MSDQKVENSSVKGIKSPGDELGVYEIGYHILSIVPEDKIADEVSKIRSIIEGGGGSFVAEEWPKTFSLAYSISRMKSGKKETFDSSHFGWMRFEVKRSSALAIREEISKLDNVLRFIIVKTSLETPSPVRPRSVLGKPSRKEVVGISDKGSVGSVSREEIDKEIEKLVVE